MEWEIKKSALKGYGILLDPKGKKYNINFSESAQVVMTTTKGKTAKLPIYVEQMVYRQVKEWLKM